MTTSLFAKPDRLEPIYGWLERQSATVVEVWGLEEGRRAALLAYSTGAGDAFGWSNWAQAAREDPSELLSLFQDVEIVLDDTAASNLRSAFPDDLATSKSASR